MRRRTFVTAMVFAGILGGAVLYSRGPVGPESILGKDVDPIVERCAGDADARLVKIEPANPGDVPIPALLKAKYAVKRVATAVGLEIDQPETATSYAIAQPGGATSVHLLVRVRGDHVLAIAFIRGPEGNAFTKQIAQAIRDRFPDYPLTELSDD